MPYEPTAWKKGDVVTSEKLNKLENGVADAGGVLVIRETDRNEYSTILDKTWNEIMAAMSSGKPCVILHVTEYNGEIYAASTEFVTAVYIEDYYEVDVDWRQFSTSDPDDYPVYAAVS